MALSPKYPPSNTFGGANQTGSIQMNTNRTTHFFPTHNGQIGTGNVMGHAPAVPPAALIAETMRFAHNVRLPYFAPLLPTNREPGR